jgi:hypothetical protein
MLLKHVLESSTCYGKTGIRGAALIKMESSLVQTTLQNLSSCQELRVSLSALRRSLGSVFLERLSRCVVSKFLENSDIFIFSAKMSINNKRTVEIDIVSENGEELVKVSTLSEERIQWELVSHSKIFTSRWVGL